MNASDNMRNLLNILDIATSKKNLNESIENPKDKVTLEIPLLIRLLEYAREDAKTDMDLHDLTEKLIAMSSEQDKTLSMQDYDQLVPSQNAKTS